MMHEFDCRHPPPPHPHPTPPPTPTPPHPHPHPTHTQMQEPFSNTAYVITLNIYCISLFIPVVRVV